MITSFGYKHDGPPSKAVKVIDVREVGHDPESMAAESARIIDDLRAHPVDGMVAVGCKLGAHRSVAIANRVATALKTSVYHRDKGMNGQTTVNKALGDALKKMVN